MEKEQKIDMQKVWSIIMDLITKQGLSFLLLAAMAYYFQMQTAQLQQKTDRCNERIIEIFQSEAEQSREVIKDNTEAINNFSHFLRENAKR